MFLNFFQHGYVVLVMPSLYVLTVFGAILAPIIDAAVGDKYIKITFYVYSGLTIIMVGIVLLLPETRNRSFDDGEQEDAATQVDDVDQDNDGPSITQAEIE